MSQTLLLSFIAAILIIGGAWNSLFRSQSTVDYYRTIVRDKRQDDQAKRFMFFYYAGMVAFVLGLLLLLVVLMLTLQKRAGV